MASTNNHKISNQRFADGTALLSDTKTDLTVLNFNIISVYERPQTKQTELNYASRT